MGRLAGALQAGVICAVGAVLIALAVLTIQRNRDFVSETVLNSIDTQTHPRAARMWSALAVEQRKAGKYREAVENAQRALKIYPPYPDAWRTMGLALFRLNDLDQAAICLRESLKTGGQGNESANVHLAKIMTMRRDYPGAISLLEEFVSEHATAADARNNLAWYLLTAEPTDVRDMPRARRYAQEAVLLRPSVGAYLDTYISVLEALGETAEARRVLSDGLPKIPLDDPDRPGLLRRRV